MSCLPLLCRNCIKKRKNTLWIFSPLLTTEMAQVVEIPRGKQRPPR